MRSSGQPDRYTAPADSVPRRRSGPVTLGECLRAFARCPSPPVLLGAVALALAVRLVQGAWSWRDAVMALGLVAITPFVEWAIHVYLLHAPPVTVLGRRVEMLTAREHRAHHAGLSREIAELFADHVCDHRSHAADQSHGRKSPRRFRHNEN